jgi:protein-S-isoprenylcysteine O-methyltransferase Ste14
VIPAQSGLAFLVPKLVTLRGLAALIAAIEIQSAVEEPYLMDMHGQAYRDYACRVGRLLPGVGGVNAGQFRG